MPPRHLVRTALLALAALTATACISTREPRERLADGEANRVTAFPFDQWDAIVRAHVDEQGRVDYAALRAERRPLERFLAYVAETGPRSTPQLFRDRNTKLAYYINAYNALVFRNVLDRPGLTNIDRVKVSFFYSTAFVVDGESRNLQRLENLIREQFGDPRIHAALNCASTSCPQLPAEAFVPPRLEVQLDREMREFVADPRNVRIEGDRVTLSKIFEWYANDFLAYERAHGAATPSVIGYINRYRPTDARIPEGATIAYAEYDWTLNARPAAR